MALHIATFNCRSAKSNDFCIKELVKSHDIVCLQETWLPMQESDFLNSLSNSHSFYASSPIDYRKQLLSGRPYSGLAFLFKKSVAPHIQYIETQDNRLLCIDVTLGTSSIRLINCYLPFNDGTNIDLYIDYLAKIHVLMDQHNNNFVFIIWRL